MKLSYLRLPVISLTSALLLAQQASAVESHIQISNCSDSHHEIKVHAYQSLHGEIVTADTSIHSGSTKQVSCSSTDCNVYFESGSHNKTKQFVSDGTHYYVHVKSNHKFSIEETESEVCGSSD